EGQNPGLDSFLDLLKARRADFNVRRGPEGVGVRFHRPFAQHLKATAVGLAFLSLWYGNATDPDLGPLVALAFLPFAAIPLLQVLIALPFDTLIPAALRTARSALLADELEVARLVLE